MKLKKLYRITSASIIILMFSILICGCVDKTELNQIALVVGMGVDKIDDNFLVTLEIVNPNISKEGNSGSGSQGYSIIETSTGKSIYEAIESFSQKSSVIMNFSHIKVIVMSKRLCESNISDLIDYIVRNREFRYTNWLLVANGAAQDIIKSKGTNEGITSLGLSSMMNKLEKDTYIVPVDVNKFVRLLEGQSKSACIPIVELEHSKQYPQGKIKIEKTAIFKNNKLVGELSRKESESLMWIQKKRMGDTVSFPIKTPDSDKKVTILVNKKSAKVIPAINKDSISFKVQCYGTAEIKEVSHLNINTGSVGTIEHSTEEILKNQMDNLINKCQNELNSDILGFSEVIYNENPKEWFKIKNQWEEIFPTVKYEVSYKIQVNIMGMIKDSPL